PEGEPVGNLVPGGHQHSGQHHLHQDAGLDHRTPDQLPGDHRLVAGGAHRCPDSQGQAAGDEHTDGKGHLSRVVVGGAAPENPPPGGLAPPAPAPTPAPARPHVRPRHGRPCPYDEVVTTLNLSSKDPARLAADALVIGVRSEGGSATVEGADFLSRSAAESVARAITLLGVTGDTGQITKIPAGDAVKADLLVLVGLGKAVEDADGRRERLRRAAGSASAALAGTEKVVLALPTDDAQDVGAVAEGALLGAYIYDRPGTDK